MILIKHPSEAKKRTAGIRRAMFGFTLCSVLTIALPGCGKAPQGKQSPVPTQAANDLVHKLTVAVVPKGTIHEYWKAVNSGAQQAGQELGVEVLWKGPLKEDDREAQIAVVEDLVSRGAAGIVLAPLDATALRGPVAGAMRTNIPVVIFDSGLSGEAGKDFVSYVATDNFKGGQLAGEAMAKLLGDKGNVIVLRYAEGSDSTLQRENGFLDAIKKHPGIKVVSENQYAGVTTESAQKAGENLLARFKQPDGSPGFDGIFCATEPTTFGMLRSLQDVGLAGKVRFIGFDSSPKMIQALQNGQLAGFVVQNPRKIGYLGVKTLVAHLRGEKVPLRLDTGATLVTADNLQTTAIATLLHPEQAQ
jgi:ribose transport system substrate-binding protein